MKTPRYHDKKSCTKCKNITDNFPPQKERNCGTGSWCRECLKKSKYQYYRTKKGLITKIYSGQRSSSKRRGHKMPTYNLDELRAWCFSQKIFHELYDLWKNNGYKKEMVPSCDRTDDSKEYSLNRLRITTWEENNKKAGAQRRAGISVTTIPQKTVEQRTLGGALINTYVSAMEASRKNGIHPSAITATCRGEQSKSCGYKWNYKKN